MINTIAALQGLYVALGGDIGDVANINTIPDMLEAVASVAGGAGGALPAVTSEDNGDILGVVEGAWAKRDPELPAVNGDDNGKILGVNNGAWDAVASPLPTVSASDNGKVLGVDNGSWGVIDAPSKIVVFDCDISSPMQDGATITLKNNKYLRDVSAAVNDGYIVYLRLGTGTGAFMGDYDFCGYSSVSGTTGYNQFFKQVVSYDNSTSTNKLYTYLIILQAVTVGGQNTGTIKVLQESVVS